MATHARHAMNGHNGNGNGGSMTQKKLEQLLEHYERHAEALRTTLGLLRGAELETKARRAPAVLGAALRLEADRHAQNGNGHAPAKPKRGAFRAAILARRKESAAWLATFSKTKPAAEIGQGKNVFVVHGYLKKVQGGFVRTDKVFTA
jgi:hypothetical protein